MIYLRHVTSTLFFALFSPVYLLYIFTLFLLSPFGAIMSKVFKRDNYFKVSIADCVEPSMDYSLNEVFTLAGVKRVAATIFFALLSPLYILYIVGLVLIAPIGLMLSRVSKPEEHDNLPHKKLNNGNALA